LKAKETKLLYYKFAFYAFISLFLYEN